MKAKLLLGSPFPEEEFGEVARYAEVYRLSEMGGGNSMGSSPL